MTPVVMLFEGTDVYMSPFFHDCSIFPKITVTGSRLEQSHIHGDNIFLVKRISLHLLIRFIANFEHPVFLRR